MRKMYLEMTKKEVLKLSIFQGLCTCVVAGSFRFGILSFAVTLIIWSLLMYIINLIWFCYARKGANKIGEKISGKIKSIKRAGKQNAMESER